MNVGINCFEIDPDYTGGVNSFALGLLEGLLDKGGDCSFTLFVGKKNQTLFKKYETCANVKLVTLPSPGDFMLKWDWRSLKLRSKGVYRIIRNLTFRHQARMIRENCDFLYTPSTTLLSYNQGIINVLSMHDIQHVHFPQFFSPMELRVRAITYELSARYSDYLQVSSKYIGEDFLKYFTFLKKEQIILISEGVDIEKFRNRDENKGVLTKYGISGDFLFYPAQLWPHKNHLTILKSLVWLRENRNISIPLVLTGAKYSAADAIFRYIEEQKLKNIFYLGKVPFGDIVSLYHHAKFLITASLHESSCLPVLEAAAAGVPIIAASIPPNVEMAEKIKMNLFPAQDQIKLGELIVDLWKDHELIQKQTAQNQIMVDDYSWKNIAGQYINHFRNIASKVKK